jgi:hypothetical protein
MWSNCYVQAMHLTACKSMEIKLHTPYSLMVLDWHQPLGKRLWYPVCRRLGVPKAGILSIRISKYDWFNCHFEVLAIHVYKCQHGRLMPLTIFLGNHQLDGFPKVQWGWSNTEVLWLLVLESICSEQCAFEVGDIFIVFLLC